MAAKFIDALVLTTPNFKKMVAFYKAIGLPLEEEKHGKGPIHFAAELGPLHFAIYEATKNEGSSPVPRMGSGGSTFVGFRVDSIAATLDRLGGVGSKVLQNIEEVPWGRRAVVEDPDGRPIELNEPLPIDEM